MGDFNMVINPTLDHMGQSVAATSPPTHTKLYRMLTDFALVDPWRYRHPLSRVYTCFSATHNSMSSIDFIFVFAIFLPELTDAGFAPRTLSGHTPYRVNIQMLTALPTPQWRLNPYWLSNLVDQEDILRELQYYFDINQGTYSFWMVWEAFKIHPYTLIHPIK